MIVLKGDAPLISKKEFRSQLEAVLPGYIKNCRWFAGKGRGIKRVHILESVPVSNQPEEVFLVFFKVEYPEGRPEHYLLPLGCALGQRARDLQRQFPLSLIAPLEVQNKNKKAQGILFEATVDCHFAQTLLDGIRRQRYFKGRAGTLRATSTKAFRKSKTPNTASLKASPLKVEQSNTSIVYGKHLILKLFRRLETGVNPELEVGRFLTEETDFKNTPTVLGSLEYFKKQGQPITVGILQSFVPNQGDAWQYTLDALSVYFEKVLSRPDKFEVELNLNLSPLDRTKIDVDPLAQELVNPYFETARLLGKRTAEMHLALSQETKNPDFGTEGFTTSSQRSLYQSVRNLTNHVFQTLRKRWKTLPTAIQPHVKAILNKQPDILKHLQPLRDRKISGKKIRHHGDFHLGQVLYIGKDFEMIDFEGEPMRSLQARKAKHSPLRDVAGMLRSFHYAAYTALSRKVSDNSVRAKEISLVEPWACFWYLWVSAEYLRAYLETAKRGSFLPSQKEDIATLLDIFTLEKAVYEINYEFNNRPEWLKIPLEGISRLLEKRG